MVGHVVKGSQTEQQMGRTEGTCGEATKNNCDYGTLIDWKKDIVRV